MVLRRGHCSVVSENHLHVRDAQVSYKSPYGQIVSDWKDNDKEFIIRVEVPANSKASIYLPAADTKQITESGVRLEDVPEINCKQEGNRYVVATTGSGIYTFKVKKNK